MISRLVLIFVVAYIAYQLVLIVRSIYFHPLARFRGPKLWIAFPLIRYLMQARGTFDKHLLKFHAQYGEVVRFDQDSLSFTTAQAWKDIYGYGHGPTQWPKVEFRPPGATPNILLSNDADHSRFRKALSWSFSDQALRLQENLIQNYVDVLINALREEAGAGKNVDMTMWYNLTTFDIISDLAFGEPSNCLKDKGYSEYIVAIFRFVKIVPYVQLMRFYPSVWAAFKYVVGKRVNASRAKLFEMGDDTTLKRKNDRSKDGRGDFMEALLKHSDSKEPISDEELSSNAHILFMAGSETTATLLAGVTYWMLRTPESMSKAIQEVRAAFEKEEDITFASASARLPYTLACLEEGLRMFPPVPSWQPRVTLETATISGYEVPPNTQVGVHQIGANWASKNFHQPNSFKPERWLPGPMSDPKSPYFNDNRDARQPFSLGPRNCIGKNLAFSEMRQILARVLWNFDLELVNKDEVWEDQKIFTLWEKGPLVCRIRMRRDQ